ncbi:AMP-binding protein [Tistrella mobilis]|uniref:class I adenylate-forming enzyme family protein n=1 Tax=Tistrella mobilis TaxID=171437 RepID=UPI0031F6DAD4
MRASGNTRHHAMFQAFVERARARPADEALVLGQVRLDYGRLLSRGLAVAGAIAGLPRPSPSAMARRPRPLRPLRLVALVAGNRIEFVEAFLGTVMAGAVVLVVDPKLTTAQGLKLFERLAPDLVIHDPAVAGWVSSPEAGLLAGGFLALTGGMGCPYRLWRDRAMGEQPATADLPAAVAPDQPFLIATTSGTSSEPKAFIRDHQSWAESFHNSIAEFAIAPGETVLAMGPLVHGLSLYATMEALAAGATAVLLDRFDATRAAAVAAAERADLLVGVPTMFEALGRGLDQARARLPGVRAVVSAGAKLPPALARSLGAALPRAEIHEYYGASELSFVTLARSGRGDPAESVGRAFRGVELRITGPAGEALPAGEVGRIDIRSRMVSAGYVMGGEDGSGFVALEEGWSTVGDLGRLDADGHLYILGRAGGMIITGGLNVYPGEVEAAIAALPGLGEALVFGVPDPYWGEAVAAVLRAGPETPPVDLIELRSRLAGRLARHKLPRMLWHVQDWPLGSSGKIARGRVRAAIAAGEAGPPQLLDEGAAGGLPTR